MGMKLGHGRDQAQEQRQKAGESAEVRAKADHAADRPLTCAADVRKEEKSTSKILLGQTMAMKEDAVETRKRLERGTPAEHTAAQDAFEAARPKGAAQAIDQDRAQERARNETQASEWQAQSLRVAKAIEAAATAMEFAAKSITARQDSTERLLHDEQTRNSAAARDRDVAQDVGADEVTTRQQGRDETIDAQLKSLAEHDLADIAGLATVVKETRNAIASLQQAQAALEADAGASHGDRLAASREQLERFDEEWRLSLSMKLLFNGRFSDIEAVKKVWDQAATGKQNTKDGFAEVRAAFWESVNEQKSDAAKEVHRLLSMAKVEWGRDTAAPLLDMQSTSNELIRKAAERGDTQAQQWDRAMGRNTRLSIDHVADKHSNPALTLDASNLRFTTHADNSARGNSYGVNDRWKADFERSEQEQAQRAETRDAQRARTAERSEDELRAKAVLLAPDRLRHVHAGAQERHEQALLTARSTHDGELRELRAAALTRLGAEAESARDIRQRQLLEVLERFQQSARGQMEAINRYELDVHSRQKRELGVVMEKLNETSITRDDATQLILDTTRRHGAERRAVEGLWDEIQRRRNDTEALLMKAIYSAKTREAQEEQLRRATSEQQRAERFLQARLDELKRTDD
jgi:hypothetical protein